MGENKLNQKFFPEPQNHFRGQWSKIQLEPIIGSEERLTVAIAITDGQNCYVEAAPALRKLKCLYGERYSHLVKIIKMSAKYIENSLNSETNFSELQHLSFSENIYITNPKPINGRSKSEVLERAFNMSSSLVSWISEGKEEILDTNQPASNSGQAIAKCVKDYISDLGLIGGEFNKKYSIRKGGQSVVINYVGHSMVASMNGVSFYQPKQSINHSKAKLLDISNYRNDIGALESKEFKFFVYAPHMSEENFTKQKIRKRADAVEEILALIDKANMQPIKCGSINEIGNEIYQSETAIGY